MLVILAGGASPLFAQGTAGNTQQAPDQAGEQAVQEVVEPTAGQTLEQSAEPASIGRLFLTPAQRVALDALRNRKPEPAPVAIVARPELEPEAEPVAAPAPPVVSELTVNGLILRKDGPSAAWVNGAPILNGAMTREGVVVRTGRGGVRMVMPSGSQTLRLRPGQKVDVVNGSVLEPYQVPADLDDEEALTAELARRLEELEAAEPSAAPSTRGVAGEGPAAAPAEGVSKTTNASRLLDELFSRLK